MAFSSAELELTLLTIAGVNGAEELTLARSPSRLGKALGRARSKSRVRRLEGKRMLLE